VVKAIFARCTASSIAGARPAAVGALRPVSRQLEALIMVTTETPTLWAAALPAAPTFTAEGDPQW